VNVNVDALLLLRVIEMVRQGAGSLPQLGTWL
jgi:hypothetical protein